EARLTCPAMTFHPPFPIPHPPLSSVSATMAPAPPAACVGRSRRSARTSSWSRGRPTPPMCCRCWPTPTCGRPLRYCCIPRTSRRSVSYRFAAFSPEWQALHYGLTSGVPARFMDLPQAYQLGDGGQGMGDGDSPLGGEVIGDTTPAGPQPPSPIPRTDPLGWLA